MIVAAGAVIARDSFIKSLQLDNEDFSSAPAPQGDNHSQMDAFFNS
jgi:ribonuclease HIII